MRGYVRQEIAKRVAGWLGGGGLPSACQWREASTLHKALVGFVLFDEDGDGLRGVDGHVKEETKTREMQPRNKNPAEIARSTPIPTSTALSPRRAAPRRISRVYATLTASCFW